MNLGQMQTEVIKERALNGSQYDNVSMGSIGSFERRRETVDPVDGLEGVDKSLIPIINNSSPGKYARQ